MATDTLSNLIFTGPLAWTIDAACEGRTELFFAPAGERPEARVVREGKARAVCTECPVLAPCGSGVISRTALSWGDAASRSESTGHPPQGVAGHAAPGDVSRQGAGIKLAP